MTNQEKWDKYFINICWEVAKGSKDPSTKVAAIITNGKKLISTGFNGFPAGIEDLDERYNNRELKYKLVVHAEMNAILFAKCNLEGYTLYTIPAGIPCIRCAMHVIQSGIKRVVTGILPDDFYIPRFKGDWREDGILARDMLLEAGVKIDFI